MSENQRAEQVAGNGERKWQETFVRLPPELHDEVKRLAAERDISMAQAIRAACRQWIKNPKLVVK